MMIMGEGKNEKKIVMRTGTLYNVSFLCEKILKISLFVPFLISHCIKNHQGEKFCHH